MSRRGFVQTRKRADGRTEFLLIDETGASWALGQYLGEMATEDVPWGNFTDPDVVPITLGDRTQLWRMDELF